MVGVLNGKKKAISLVVVAFLLCGLVGGLVIQQSLADTTIQIYDDETSFWTAGGSTTVTTDYARSESGVLSLRCNTSGGVGSFYHNYGVNQNFTGLTEYWVRFWWYGNASAAQLCLTLYNSSWTGYFNYAFYDCPKGWSEYAVKLGNMQNVSGSWETIYYFGFSSLDADNTWYVDNVRLVLASEVDTMSLGISGWGGMVVSLFLIVVCLVLALKSRSWAVNFLFGLGTVGFLGWVFANATVEVYGGWLMYMVLLSAVLALTKGAVLVRASGV